MYLSFFNTFSKYTINCDSIFETLLINCTGINVLYVMCDKRNQVPFIEYNPFAQTTYFIAVNQNPLLPHHLKLLMLC